MSVGTVITLGYGSFGTPSLVITLGYSLGAVTDDDGDGLYFMLTQEKRKRMEQDQEEVMTMVMMILPIINRRAIGSRAGTVSSVRKGPVA